MTEAEWLAATDPSPMLALVPHRPSSRKLRLLAVGVAHSIWYLLPPRCRTAAAALELYADKGIGTDAHRQAWAQADIESRMCAQDPPDETTYAAESVMISDPPTTSSVEYALSTAAIAIGCDAAKTAADRDYDTRVEAGQARAARDQAHLVRCVFGNPFRPVAFDPRWRTADVLGLARGIYDDRAFDRLPLLADALMDAGCDDDQILDHCRSEGPHVRGCWVVDLMLGKE